LPRRLRKSGRRVVVDTSVLVAGISGFKKAYVAGRIPSADVLFRWAGENNFVWLVSEEILDEYKQILRRRHVRSHIIGKIVNLIRERAEYIEVPSSFEISPDPDDNPFCSCAETGKADFIVTLNPKDFPEDRLKAAVLTPDRLD
jgi:putative PIN family toxin of toxin-antitoxin system